MSNQPTQSSDNGADGRGEDARAFSRRTVLGGAVAAGAGALVLGTGTVSADGKGGQGIIVVSDKTEYDSDATFKILEVDEEECNDRHPDGSCLDFDKRLQFQCQGEGGRFPPGKNGKIPFPWWTLKYTSGPLEGETMRLYTRDNSIDTSATYRWTRKEKYCPETEAGGLLVYQVGFTSDNG